MQYHMPPYATSTLTSPKVGTLILTSRPPGATNAGWFFSVISVALPLEQAASISMRPAGASRVKEVTGSTIGIIPVSSSAVAVQIVLWPDMAG